MKGFCFDRRRDACATNSTCGGSCEVVRGRGVKGLRTVRGVRKTDFMKAILHSGLAGMVSAELRCWHTLLWG
jgi:hypothetical protein